MGELNVHVYKSLIACCRVSTIKKFPTDMMDTLRMMIIQEPHHFLMLSRTKQELLVDKMVQRLVSNPNPIPSKEKTEPLVTNVL